ncbi:MAG TPA: hypothetical protein VN256_06840 [Pyrinomonadaceae bacterium]|nr:hypothetical protein [Pyrinomonadaceae bacterium]
MPEEITPQDNMPAGEPSAQGAVAQGAPPARPPAQGQETAGPSQAQPQDEDKRASSNVEVRSEVINAGGSVISANIVNEYYTALTEGGEDSSIRAFSAEYCDPIAEEKERELKELVVFEEKLMSELLSALLSKRFLILAGERETGKQTLALHLSQMLRQCAGEPCRETLLARALQRRVRVELQKVAEARKDFGQRAVIFPRIGESENRDLLGLFARLQTIELEHIVDALRRNGSFFLFTVDTPHIKLLKDDLQALGVLREIPPLPRHLLELGLEKKLTRFLAERDIPAEQAEHQAARKYVSENKALLLERLPKMSQLALFVERYLLRLVGEHPEMDLRAAIDLAASPEKWFLNDLGKDFEAWCFVFTLALCLCGAGTKGVPWLEFETIRREIVKHLSRELRLWRHQQESPLSNLLAEQALLERCRAQIVREVGYGDLVRFTDSSYPAELWRVFTSSNRQVLTLILPVLQRLAQSGDTQIRARAARMLGRIGEINPSLITLGLIGQWANAKSFWQKAAVGYLYEGVWDSQDESYRQLCQLKLEQLADSDGDELWTAIAVYKQRGQSGGEHLATAIAKLGEITEQNFTGWLEWEKKIEQELESFEQKKQKNRQEVVVASKELKELRKALNRLYHDEDGKIMLAICFSLVALSRQAGAFAVMVELNNWFRQGRKGLAPLTSWIFWMEAGIADRLGRPMPVPHAAVNDTIPSCHPVVIALGAAAKNEPQAISQAASFLAATYQQFSESFHPRVRQYLRRKFLLHLKSWADSSWLVPEYRQVMKDLYVELLLSPQDDLVRNVTMQLKSDPEFTGRAHLKRFADLVLERRQEIKR